MRKKSKRRKIGRLKTRLGFPDLDQSKAAVIGSLRSPESQRGYRHAIDEFIEWYCSEPRLSFNRTVVLRYRNHLESRNLAPGTINVRLAAVRRLAYEASDAGLLSPELAWHPAREGVQEAGSPIGNLVIAKGSARVMEISQQRDAQRQTRPCDYCCPAGVRSPTTRIGRPQFRHLQHREDR
jgi:hypothetical protein